MLEIYAGRRGSTAAVANPAVASARYQKELMDGGTGWFRVLYADGAITIAPIGLEPLTFETEGNVALESARSTRASKNKLDPRRPQREHADITDLEFAC
ncbi:MAG: hypothetical protein LAO56_25795 [Acidobacteriia bacterium]|nr:hypothetical protein [Terriglobia bacterium]